MLKITQIKETRKTRDWHADWATFEPYTVLCVIYLSSDITDITCPEEPGVQIYPPHLSN